MGKLSPMAGIHNYLKKHGYTSKLGNPSKIVKQYQDETGIKMDLRPLFVNQAYGKYSKIREKQEMEFKAFVKWIKSKANKQ